MRLYPLYSLIWSIVVQYEANALKNCSVKYKIVYILPEKVAINGKYLKRDHVTPLLNDLKWINFKSILQLIHP